MTSTHPTDSSSRRLGATGPTVAPLGLGLMGMSDLYGPADDAESIATIHAALDAGVTLLDTGDFYGMGHNELLLREALRGRDRDDAVISVKFGALRGPDGSWIGVDTRPAAIKNFLAYTLQRLGTDHVDIYRPARLDPTVPIEETVGAIAELVEAGYVRHIGLSEVGADTLRRAHAVHPIADLQIEYSLISRGIEAEILPDRPRAGHRDHGVRRALPRPALGPLDAPTATSRDFRAHLPRFSGDNLAAPTCASSRRSAPSPRRGAPPSPRSPSPGSRSQGEDIVPLVGARPGPARGVARRPGPGAQRRRPRRHRGRRARRTRPPAPGTTRRRCPSSTARSRLRP